MLTGRTASTPPLFSVCIPQYNRTSFLRILIDSLQAQVFKDLEICISDGGSDDGRHHEILSYLEASGMAFRVSRQETNLAYDANLRASIALASGKYCVLFGNDDALADSHSLEDLAVAIRQWSFPDVVLTNYSELSSGTVRRRVRFTGTLGAGPLVASQNFRNFSFVSGIALAREPAQRFATAKWDGSEMYQMYLGCRMIAAGGRLLGLDRVIVHKDIQLPGETVDSYARRPQVQIRRIREITLPLCRYGQVAFDAIAPFFERADRRHLASGIMMQVIVFTYPPWLIEYRRVQSWRFAVCFALGMRPRKLLGSTEVGWWSRICLRLCYGAFTMAGLIIPARLFEALRPWFYDLAKRSAVHREAVDHAEPSRSASGPPGRGRLLARIAR